MKQLKELKNQKNAADGLPPIAPSLNPGINMSSNDTIPISPMDNQFEGMQQNKMNLQPINPQQITIDPVTGKQLLMTEVPLPFDSHDLYTFHDLIVPGGKNARLCLINEPFNKNLRITEIADHFQFYEPTPVIVLIGANTKNKVKAIRDICNLTEDTACFEIEETYVKGMNLDDYINNHLEEHNNFQKTLFSMIDERGLTDSEVYNKVNISRKLFSKIRTDNEYHPSRETVILLGLSLELSLDDMLKLLDSASYSLAKNNAFDLIIRFSCHSHIYDLDLVNEMLDEYSCKLLNC